MGQQQPRGAALRASAMYSLPHRIASDSGRERRSESIARRPVNMVSHEGSLEAVAHSCLFNSALFSPRVAARLALPSANASVCLDMLFCVCLCQLSVYCVLSFCLEIPPTCRPTNNVSRSLPPSRWCTELLLSLALSSRKSLLCVYTVL